MHKPHAIETPGVVWRTSEFHSRSELFCYIVFINEISNGPSSGTNITSYADYTQIWRGNNCEEDNNNLLSLAVRNKMKIHLAKYKVLTLSDPNSRSPSLGILPCIRTHTQWEIPCWISTTLTPKKISGFL